MTKYLITIVTVGVILFLGTSIDIQSRTEAVRNAPADELLAIYAAGRVEGATEEVNLRPQLHGSVAELRLP